MNKHTKTILVFALVLIFALSAALLAACDKDKDPSTTTYTVTVTCDDASALANVKVQLNKADGTSAAEAKALENGKATFDLAPADYTATLTGVPSGYQFENGSLTATTTACTIVLTATRTYTVTLTYPDVTDVYGNKLANAGAASGVTVAMYEGELTDDTAAALAGKTPAATATTDATGKATFNLTGDLYTVVLSGYLTGLHIDYPQGKYVLTVDKTAPDKTVTFTLQKKAGTSSNPLELQLGANEIPLTNDALELAGGIGVCYSFTPDETGNYTFTTTGNAIVMDDATSAIILQGETSTVLTLTAGETYIYYCTASGVASTYTLTIAKGGEITPPGGDTNYPWTEGEGTVANPFTTTTLAGTYNLHIEASSPIYLAYTPTANETYTFSTTSNDLWIEIYDDVEKLQAGDDSLLQLSDTIKSGEITLTAATKYYILIGTWNDDENDINFTATKSGSSQPSTPWTSGEGTLASPYVLTTLENTYTLQINLNALVYLTYTPAENETYTLTTTDSDLWLTIFEYDGEDRTNQKTFGNGAESLTITLNANTKYYFEVDLYNEDYGNSTTFTATKSGSSQPSTPWTSGEGTLASPYVLTTLENTYTLQINLNALVYLTYTPAENETYTLTTTDSDLWLTIFEYDGEDRTNQKTFGNGAESLTITLNANTKYYFEVDLYNEDYGNSTTFTATKSGSTPPTPSNPWTSGEGTQASPYVLTSLEHTFTFTINDGALVYLKYTPSTTETYIVSSTDENIYLDIYKDTMQSMSTNISKEASLSATITFEEGHTYFFKVDVFTYGEETTFTCAKQTTGGDTDPEGNITFTVTVLGKGADGQTTPLAGVTVTIRDDIENPTTKTTDDQGKVTFTEKSGTYGILITGYPDTYQDDPYASYSVSATQRDLTITLNEVVQYDLAVTVKTVTGESVGEGVQIDAVDDSYNTYSAKTDAQGIAHIKAPAGTYTIQIKKFLMPGFVDNGPTGDNFEFPADMYTVTVTEAGAAITVQYQYLRTLDVTVKNADGTAVEAGTKVTIMDDIGHKYSATTDASGVAHFDKAGEDYLHDTETYSVYVEGNEDSLGDVTINGESNTKEVTLPAKAA